MTRPKPRTDRNAVVIGVDTTGVMRSVGPSAWIVLGTGYLASGLDKLSSPSWQEGSAVRTILMSPIAYWGELAAVARGIPDGVIRCLSWAVVSLEIGFFVFIWNRWTRCLAWVGMTLMHLGIRGTLDLHTVTDPFLISQILTFDRVWCSKLNGQSEMELKHSI